MGLFRCKEPGCNSTFRKLDNYTRHWRSLHQLSSSDPCPMCLLHDEIRRFSRHDGLQAHYLRIHGLHLGSPLIRSQPTTKIPSTVRYNNFLHVPVASLPVRRQSHLRGLVALHTLDHALTLSMIGMTAMRTAKTERSINTWSPTTTPALSCRKPTIPIEMSLLRPLLDWLPPSAHRQGRPGTLSPSIHRWAPCPRAGRHFRRLKRAVARGTKVLAMDTGRAVRFTERQRPARLR